MKPEHERKIKPSPAVAEKVEVTALGSAKDWLQQQAAQRQFQWLLAHADDGVIWGRLDDGHLVTSHDVAQGDAAASPYCAELRTVTLQQARLFGERAELLLWRDGDNVWHARVIREPEEGAGDKADWLDALEEWQMLWGTQGNPLASTFTLLWDGAQGLRHAVPMSLPLANDGKTTPPRLHVRHYLDKEDDFARIVVSRLVSLEVEKEPNP
jgi:CRISPR-associated protein (TIGR03984 family)